MGLDIYLKAEKYIPGWDHCLDAEKEAFADLLKAAGLERSDVTDDAPSAVLSVNVAYWRKANAIHKWFVDNVQGGVDDCGCSDVSREQLQSLVELCKQVLSTLETVPGEISTGATHYPTGEVVKHTRPGPVVAQPGIAASLLPTQSGFFFGGTDYDEYYLDDLRSTVKQIEAALNNPRLADWCFQYRASW